MTEFTHFTADGASQMVDVSAKPVTARLARAESRVRMQPETLAKIQNQHFSKGSVLEVARLAGIMATKRTGELIPLCHPIGIDSVTVQFEIVSENTIRIEAVVQVQARTGVEMEALMAVSVAALTIYDMCKSVDRGMQIGPTRLLEKSGGKSGTFRAGEQPA